MGLHQQPDGFKAEFAHTTPAGSQALHEAQLGGLARQVLIEHLIRIARGGRAAARSTLTTEIAWELEGHFDHATDAAADLIRPQPEKNADCDE